MWLIAQAKKGAPVAGGFCDDSARTQSEPSPSCNIATGGGDGSLDDLKGKNVVLVGNSFVAMWTAAVAASLPRTSHLTSLATGACVPYDFAGRVLKTSPFFNVDCAKWAQWEIDQVQRIKPALAVISVAPLGYWESRVNTPRAVAKLVGGIEKAGTKVLWIGAVPQAQPWNKCVEGSGDISKCAVTKFWGVTMNPEVRSTAEALGAKYWDVQPLFCTARACPALLGGKPIRADGFHLTQSSIKGVEPQLRAAMREALGDSLAN
jgi:hypothetical protein